VLKEAVVVWFEIPSRVLHVGIDAGHKNLIPGSRYPGRGLNPGLHDYQTGLLSTQPLRPIDPYLKSVNKHVFFINCTRAVCYIIVNECFLLPCPKRLGLSVCWIASPWNFKVLRNTQMQNHVDDSRWTMFSLEAALLLTPRRLAHELSLIWWPLRVCGAQHITATWVQASGAVKFRMLVDRQGQITWKKTIFVKN
jgi:hypothetical protein